MSKHLWNEFEKFLGRKYPQFIKDILEANGLDNSLSFDLINPELVDNLEKFVEDNKSFIQNTPYEDITSQFRFLIGHRLLILDIPIKYREFVEYKNNQRLIQKEKLSALKGTDKENASEPSEIIKHLLLNKLNEFTGKHQLNTEIGSDHIENFIIKNDDARCEVKCPYCDKRIPCNYNSHWKTSNFYKHIKSHIQIVEVDEKTSEQSIEHEIEPEMNLVF